MTRPAALLEIRGLEVSYGRRKIVEGLDVVVHEKDILLLLGHNGAGKTTLLRAVFGLLQPTGGSVSYSGQDITGRRPMVNARSGIGFVPQGHAIFRRLTVRENLMLGGFVVPDKSMLPERLETVHEFFPILSERSSQVAGMMSGGQQQMLALGIALMQAPRLLLLDEPSIGLAPSLVGKVMEAVVRIRNQLGATVVIVEQNVEKSLPIATKALIMRTGRKVYEGQPEPLADHATLIQYF